MPPARRKKPRADLLTNAPTSRTTKNVRQGPNILNKSAVAAIVASVSAHPVAESSSLSDGEFTDEEMDVGPSPTTTNDLLHTPNYHSPPLQQLAQEVTTENTTPQSDLASGLAHSMHANSLPFPARPSTNTASRSQPHQKINSPPKLSSTDTNEFSTILLAWQNAGSQFLQSLPSNISADLKAVMNRCAARVIVGLSVLDECPPLPNTPNFASSISKTPTSLENLKSTSASPSTTILTNSKAAQPSFAKVTASGNNSPESTTKQGGNSSKSLLPERILDSRVIIRLPIDHPLKLKDPLLTRTKLRTLISRPELIKNIRTVPSGIALVAPTSNLAPELLEAAKALQPQIGDAPIEIQEKRFTYLLGPVPKFEYNASGNPETLTFEEIKNELKSANIDLEIRL